jgi:hypothetical protein
MFPYEIRAENFAVAGGCADAQMTAGDRKAAQFVQASDIDEKAGACSRSASAGTRLCPPAI